MKNKHSIHFCYYCGKTMYTDRLGIMFRVRKKEFATAHQDCRLNAVREERNQQIKPKIE